MDDHIVIQLGALVCKLQGIFDLDLLLGREVQASQQHLKPVRQEVALHTGAPVRFLAVFVLVGNDGDGCVGINPIIFCENNRTDGIVVVCRITGIRRIAAGQVITNGIQQVIVQLAAGREVHIPLVGTCGDNDFDVDLIPFQGRQVGLEVVYRPVQSVDNGAVGCVVLERLRVQGFAVNRQSGTALRHHKVFFHFGAAVVLQQAAIGRRCGIFRLVRVHCCTAPIFLHFPAGFLSSRFRIARLRFTGFRLAGFRFTGFRLGGFRFTGFRLGGFRFTGFRLARLRFARFRFANFRLGGFLVSRLATGSCSPDLIASSLCLRGNGRRSRAAVRLEVRTFGINSDSQEQCCQRHSQQRENAPCPPLFFFC